MTTNDLSAVRPGLIMALCALLFGLALGTGFGVAEDSFKEWVASGIAAHPNLHDAKSPEKIWRYVQRAHFHALGIAAFSVALLGVVTLSRMGRAAKRLVAWAVGIGNLYPLAWLSMFLLAPSLGRDAAHHAWPVSLFAALGVVGLGLAIVLVLYHLLTGERAAASAAIGQGVGNEA